MFISYLTCVVTPLILISRNHIVKQLSYKFQYKNVKFEKISVSKQFNLPATSGNMSKLSFLIFLVIVIICVLVSLASGANLIQFGTRQPGDVEIFRIANESLVSEEIEMHATYFKWEQHGGRQYTAGEITVNKVSFSK